MAVDLFTRERLPADIGVKNPDPNYYVTDKQAPTENNSAIFMDISSLHLWTARDYISVLLCVHTRKLLKKDLFNDILTDTLSILKEII